MQRLRIHLDGALCLACNCYEKGHKKESDPMWDLDLHARLVLADAGAIIGPSGTSRQKAKGGSQRGGGTRKGTNSKASSNRSRKDTGPRDN